MKKETNITQDKTQTRSTIPKKFVDEFEVTKKDKIEWNSKNGKLKGELKSIQGDKAVGETDNGSHSDSKSKEKKK